CFRQMDGFKDVRPFIGKGVKHYKMQGLYGAQTQNALVICDTLLKHKNLDLDEMVARFQELTQGGPEGYFGVYRRPEAYFRKTVSSFSRPDSPSQVDRGPSNGAYLSAAIPIALYYHDRPQTMQGQCLKTCMRMSQNLVETTGAALTGFLVHQLLSVHRQEEPVSEIGESIMRAAVDYCEATESTLEKLYPQIWDETPKQDRRAVGSVFRLLADHWRQCELKDFPALICRHASAYARVPLSRSTQGNTLTLLPLAATLLFKTGSDFAAPLTSTLNMGGEADKLGALVGAFAGALHGLACIPPPWKSRLVNAGEIKRRGEALALRRYPSGLRGLYEMESSLTLKEREEGKKYIRLKPRKPQQKTKPTALSLEEDAALPSISKKDDPALWRKRQKEKTKNKRDRRKNLGGIFQ
ncbi:MAG: ADP-ribosylglycohydrolase family protein, partial [Nitrospinales bacterium]